jgi:serine/threonine protein kinase
MEFGSPRAAVHMGELCRARLVLGTVGYMSLEQARGQVSTDALTIHFGAILYEMLSGKRAFKGGSSVETIDAILKEDRLELTDGEVHMPPGLQRVMRRCTG